MLDAATFAHNPNWGNGLRLHVPPAEPVEPARWLINGFPARIITWTAEEWARLVDRPLDAQCCPNGIWCALRMD